LNVFKDFRLEKWLKPRLDSGLDWLIVFQIAWQRCMKYGLHHHCSPPEPKTLIAAPPGPQIANDKNFFARSRDRFAGLSSPLPSETATTKKGLSCFT
jgi:hypothetical protein